MSSKVRVAIAALAAGPRVLSDAASHHLAGVLRLRAGDRFVAFDPAEGVEAEAHVVRVERGTVHAEIEAPAAAARVAARAVTWIQGLPKGDKMDGIVRDATELGATRVVAATTAFTVVRLDGPRAQARVERWTRIAREAARQCGRADPPAIDPPRAWAAALAAAPGDAARFCFDPRAKDPLGPALLCALDAGAACAFAAGPEGGLSEGEVEEARARGFQVSGLGDFVLRAETVAAAVLGAVRLWGGPG